MGGGFGGCAIVLASPQHVDSIIKSLGSQYEVTPSISIISCRIHSEALSDKEYIFEALDKEYIFEALSAKEYIFEALSAKEYIFEV